MSDGAIVALHVAMKRPLLVMAGDDDEMDPEHTLALYQGLPVGELAIVPGTSHGFLVEKPDICNALLEHATKEDDHLRQTGQVNQIDDKTVFIIKRA